VYAEHLPPESATATAVRNAADELPDGQRAAGPRADPGAAAWSQAEMLLAALVDELRGLRHDYASVNSDKPGRPPDPVPRPGTVRKRRPMTVAQAAQLDPRLRGRPA